MLTRQLRDSGGLNVRAVTIARGRIDVTIQFEGRPVDPDAEYRTLATVANRVWDLTASAGPTDTVAVTAWRESAPNAVVERNTYFYYRPENRETKQR